MWNILSSVVSECPMILCIQYVDWVNIRGLLVSLLYMLIILEPVAEFLELKLSPLEFRAWFLLVGVGNFIVCMIIEKFITGNETVRLRYDQLMKSCYQRHHSGQCLVHFYISC